MMTPNQKIVPWYPKMIPLFGLLSCFFIPLARADEPAKHAEGGAEERVEMVSVLDRSLSPALSPALSPEKTAVLKQPPTFPISAPAAQAVCGCTLRQAIHKANCDSSITHIMFAGHQFSPGGTNKVIVVTDEDDCWLPDPNDFCASDFSACNGTTYTGTVPGSLGNVDNVEVTHGPLPAIDNTMTVVGHPQTEIIPEVRILPSANYDAAGGQENNGLVLKGDNSLVAGLIITGFPDNGLVIQADTCRIEGNYLGVYQDPVGTKDPLAPWVDAGNGGSGMVIEGVGKGNGNKLGGEDLGNGEFRIKPNVMSGNDEHGLEIRRGRLNSMFAGFYGVGYPRIRNTAGVIETFTPSTDLGNGLGGAFVHTAAGPQIFGRSVEPSGCGNPIASGIWEYVANCPPNIYSNNGLDGIRVNGGESSGDVTKILFNHIGTDIDGDEAIGNGRHGVLLYANADRTEVSSNVISGNADNGVLINGLFDGQGQPVSADEVWIHSNKIGTDKDALNAVPNLRAGVGMVHPSKRNKIGVDATQTPFAGERNFIMHNRRQGINILGGGNDDHRIIGNDITDNNFDGVHLDGSTSGVVVGVSDTDIPNGLGFQDVETYRNIISFNNRSGVLIEPDASENVVAGNVIESNSLDGVFVRGTMNLIGSNLNGDLDSPNLAGSAEKNEIRDNLRAGVSVRVVDSAGRGVHALENCIIGNEITGSGPASLPLPGPNFNPILNRALPLTGSGIVLIGAYDNYVIGNLVDENRRAGVVIASASRDNRFFDNTIGTVATGNGSDGVWILNSPFNVVGRENAPSQTLPCDEVAPQTPFPYENSIVGNAGHGVSLDGSDDTLVAGNTIGSNGFEDTDNQGADRGGDGVYILGPADNNQIGCNADGVDDSLEANVIELNVANGVRVEDDDPAGDPPLYNFILANELDGNGLLEIDLHVLGETSGQRTVNDMGDGDSGPNEVQNYPNDDLTESPAGPGMVSLSGTLDSDSTFTYRIEVYADNGTFLGNGQTTTSGSVISFSITVADQTSYKLTATRLGRTTPDPSVPGSTSEISPSYTPQ